MKLGFTKHTKQAGFGLIEVMVAIAIIAIISSVVGPSLFSRSDKAKVVATKSQMANLSTALSMYNLDNQSFPSTNQGLDALVTEPSGYPEAKNWAQGGYMSKLPKDSWGNDFIYIMPGSNAPFEIISYGSDGVDGGENTAADILSSDL